MTPLPDLDRSVRVLRRGGLVAFPTETVYGLGADAGNDDALARLYAVKGRPAEHPLIVHLAAGDDPGRYASAMPPSARRLAERCWPGPLTIVVPAGPAVSRVATGGLATVGLRVPDHPVALALLDQFAGAIAAPSANRFGKVSPTTADAVRRDLGPDVDVVLDGGTCAVGVESTIVDCTAASVRVLRLGGVPVETLAEILGTVPAIGGTTRAPGTLPSHYAPDAVIELVEAGEVSSRARELAAAGRTVGLLGLRADVPGEPGDGVVVLARVGSDDAYAHVLYTALREADDLGIETVLAVAPGGSGMGAAVADRLRRAAAGR